MMNSYMRDSFSEHAGKPENKKSESQMSFSSPHTLCRLTGHVAVFEMDECGFISKWPSKAEQLYGYDNNEILGKHIATLYTDGDLYSGRVVHELQAVEHRGAFVSYSWQKRKDGDRLWTYSECHAIKDAAGRLLGYRKYVVEATN
jgi:PAS domain S-box-containing protein